MAMNQVIFTINGEPYSLSGTEVSARTSLNDFLRLRLQLYGTKAMCREGGCGACVVTAARTHPITHEKQTFAVNSCLIPILLCHKWDITTIEGVGGRTNGYHPIQRRLAEHNGTQCGYCSPGWVMGMYSLQKRGPIPNAFDLECSFAAHICRCTGYRPILDAFKTFASDRVEPIRDVEDLDKMRCLRVSGSPPSGEWCMIESESRSPQMLELSVGPALLPPSAAYCRMEQNAKWIKPYTIDDIFKVITREGASHCHFVAGSTASGLYPEDAISASVIIDISSVAELQTIERDQNLKIGAGCTLTDAIDAMNTHAAQRDEFKYLGTIANHLYKVAHPPVRNVGTLGGNLAIKHAHLNFPSDVAVLLDTVGACITIMDSASRTEAKVLTVKEFLDTRAFAGKLIVAVKLPPLSSTTHLKTFKIMPRAQSTPALVNAGFLFEFDSEHKVKKASIVYGNLGPGTTRASNTEKAILGKELFSNDTLQAALKALNEELTPEETPPEMSAACKKKLALSLLYKAILALSPADKVSPRYASGGTGISRGESKGEQKFPQETNMFPITQPVMKLEALAQCSGEATYACDTWLGARALHGALVLADAAPAKIAKIDTKAALDMSDGVVAVLTASDIPGANCFTPIDVFQEVEEPFLAAKETQYEGQPICIVVAVDRDLAERAARAVRVAYEDVRTPVLTIKDATKAPDANKRVIEALTIDPKDRGDDVVHVIKGNYEIPGQYHFTMEPQSCVAWPTEGGIRLRSATQWMDLVQVAVAQALKLQDSQVEVESGPVGGGYGGKASRSAMIACACALAAHKTGRPVSLALSLDHNMRAVGARQHCLVDYEIGCNETGVIQYVDLKYYSDCGCAVNDSAVSGIGDAMQELYDTARWKIKGYNVLTDTASNTWCRAPGTTEANAIVEHVMERVAHVTKLDPLAVRFTHVKAEHKDIVTALVEDLKTDCEWDTRQTAIAEYNSKNAWKKRALSMSLMAFPIDYDFGFPVTINVYHADGTVLASHGGIEMGQGINTKLAQVIAHSLGIHLENVRVRFSDTVVSPNAMVSSGSITSESIANAALKACAELVKRIDAAQPKEDQSPPRTWLERVQNAHRQNVILQAVAMTGQSDGLTGYKVYGACALEAEVDCVSGARAVIRCDVCQDTGRSISPNIDVGQVEGALIMGLAIWGLGSERLRRSPSGRLLSATTWRYAPPAALDIPQTMRVILRDDKKEINNVAPVLRSKATGEPALVLAVVLTHAIREAVRLGRKEYGYNDEGQWIHIDVPNDTENILTALSPKLEAFKLQ